jgi:Pyridoxal-phosphate dependent enzyme
VIVVPVGGGSGAAGACIVAKAIDPAIRVIGVQSDAASAAFRSWRERRLVQDKMETCAEGLPPHGVPAPPADPLAMAGRLRPGQRRRDRCRPGAGDPGDPQPRGGSRRGALGGWSAPAGAAGRQARRAHLERSFWRRWAPASDETKAPHVPSRRVRRDLSDQQSDRSHTPPTAPGSPTATRSALGCWPSARAAVWSGSTTGSASTRLAALTSACGHGPRSACSSAGCRSGATTNHNDAPRTATTLAARPPARLAVSQGTGSATRMGDKVRTLSSC